MHHARWQRINTVIGREMEQSKIIWSRQSVQLRFIVLYFLILCSLDPVLWTREGLGNVNVVSSHGYNAVCIFVSVGVDISADGPVWAAVWEPGRSVSSDGGHNVCIVDTDYTTEPSRCIDAGGCWRGRVSTALSSAQLALSLSVILFLFDCPSVFLSCVSQCLSMMSLWRLLQ